MSLHNGFRLNEWLVEPDQGRIIGPHGDAHLTPRTMEVLVLLASRAGELVTRAEFEEEIWRPAIVTDDALTRCIGELRRQFGDEAANPRFVETVPKRGYRLVATVEPMSRPTEPGSAKTSPRRTRSGIVAILAISVLLTLIIAGSLLFNQQTDEITEARPSLAVLPFLYLSTDPQHAYFAGGLHDELLTQLSKAADLSLRGRTSVMGYADTTKSVGQIAEELRVDKLVEGSVQVVDGRLRINVQLIDARTDEHLWAESYDRTFDDAFAIQTDIVRNVVRGIGTVLTPEEQAAITDEPTENPEAWRLYLQGRDYQNRSGYARENWESAQQLYERALALDPKFVLAHVALAEIHGRMHWFRYDPSPERVAAHRQSAETAVRLAPDSPHARKAMGVWHYWGATDWQSALTEFEAAVRLAPNDAELVARIGQVHRRLGHWDQALAAFQRAAELNPRDANLVLDLGGYTYRRTRQYEEAIKAFEQALTMAPDFHLARVHKAWSHFDWHGDIAPLRETLDALPENADLGGLGTVASQRAQLLLIERDAEGLLTHLENTSEQIFEGGILYMTKSLHEGWAHRLNDDAEAASAAFAAALELLDDVPVELEDDWRVRVARGLALAGLGRHDQALEEADWLEASPVYRDDALIGRWLARDRTWILAQAGEHDTALEEIERLLSNPSPLNVHTLQLDPRWDPLREHHRFSSLIDEHTTGEQGDH
jgi:TolB-like protein/DNA-binding winged helix-turn-helix (wHTH) protein/Flp pilus assembly protein TadD